MAYNSLESIVFISSATFLKSIFEISSLLFKSSLRGSLRKLSTSEMLCPKTYSPFITTISFCETLKKSELTLGSSPKTALLLRALNASTLSFAKMSSFLKNNSISSPFPFSKASFIAEKTLCGVAYLSSSKLYETSIFLSLYLS